MLIRKSLGDAAQRSTARLAALILAASLVLAARGLYIWWFGSGVPFYDQWDAEGLYFLKPWVEGELHWSDWLAPHNEHRILFSRLLFALVFEAFGRWDNIPLALASSLVAAVVAGALGNLAWRSVEPRFARPIVLALLVALLSGPFSWANILVGFQSQFYFMILFGVLAVTTASRPTTPVSFCATLLLSLAACLSMASGLLAAVAAGLVVSSRLLNQRRAPWWDVCLIAILAALAVGSYFAVPVIPPHKALQASSIGDFLRALSIALSWPSAGNPLLAVALWLPTAVSSFRVINKAALKDIDFAVLGVAFFSFAQAAAMAYSRGAGMAEVASRYTDLLALGVFANALLVFRLFNATPLKQPRPRLAVLAGSLWAGGLLLLIVLRFPSDISAMAARHAQNCVQHGTLQVFLADQDRERLVSARGSLPYPDPDRLFRIATDPTIKPLLERFADSETLRGCARISSLRPGAAYGFPSASVVGLGSVGVGGRAEAIPQSGFADLSIVAPAKGKVVGLGLLVGTFGGKADGELSIELCSDEACARGSILLDRALDNQVLRVPLSPALNVESAHLLSGRMSVSGGEHPVAVWTYSAAQPALSFRRPVSEFRAAVGELAVVE